jgi:O-acetyl-ADP-ribose deacetylase (regulator of RNase III)
MVGGPETILSKRVGGTIVEAISGDITSLDVDAVVNAANNYLWMGAGVAGAIKAAGGVIIEEEAVAKGPITVGSAIETTAGLLQAKVVIHAAVMGTDLQTDLVKVAEATRSVLDVTRSLGLTSVAFPLLGTGVGGLDETEVARTMAEEIASFAVSGDLDGIRVVIVGYGPSASKAVRDAVAGL